MEQFSGCIYRLFCKETGKSYIGQTVNFKRRMYYHFNKNTIKFNNSPLYADLVKYGKDAFVAEVLMEVEAGSKKELFIKMLSLEKEKIIEYNSIENGYNRELGNELTPEMIEKMRERGRAYSPSLETRRKISAALMGRKMPPKTDEMRKHMSDAQKGKKRSEESKKKQSDSMKGKRNHFYGKTHTEEARKKIREGLRGKQAGAKNPAARAVRCIETGEIFETAVAAGKSKGISSPCNISFVCTGKTLTCGGYHWEYADEAERESSD